MKNPNLIPKPFAQNGQKDTIPENYKSDLPSQKATWETGFPQITMMPVTAGGLPPSGRDFNGILNQISDNIVHLSKGGKFKYSQEYADSVGGYPKGAILQSDDETKEFQSLIDNNKVNFNTEPTDKVNTAWKLVSTSDLLDELNKKLNRSDVVQSVGNGKAQVMSQNAVTDVLNTKQDKGDYATNTALNQVNDNANTRLEKAKNGSDIPDAKEFVKNLGLGDSVYRAIGNGRNQIPDMSFFDGVKSLHGKQSLPGGLVFQWVVIPSSATSNAVTLANGNYQLSGYKWPQAFRDIFIVLATKHTGATNEAYAVSVNRHPADITVTWNIRRGDDTHILGIGTV
jgi:hypothetical protein